MVSLTIKNKMSNHSQSNIIRSVLSDSERKSICRIILEAIYLGFKNGELPKYYFTRFLYRQGVKNINDYISTYKNVSKIHRSRKIHNPCVEEILENKLLFSYFFDGKKVATPKMLGFNMQNIFYSGNTVAKIRNQDDLVAFFKKNIFKDGISEVFIKPIHGSGGGNHHRINLSDLTGDSNFFNILGKANFVFQKCIVQHPDLAKVFPGSVNTVRLVSYYDQSEVKFIGGYFRFGSGKSCVDNGCAGGGSVGFDLETGKLNKLALQLLDSGGKIFTEHPETKFVFDGFQIPLYEEVKQLVRDTVEILPVKLAGWDIAITKEGPILIEGNHDFHLGLCEVIAGGCGKDPIYQRILEEANE